MKKDVSRTCFVIMPFSATKTCTEHEWTDIFESILKPAVEAANLGYECRRSDATRGNIVKGIVRDLNDAHVVIADLTDRNANVFYELGVRHALTNRTIILAQNRDDIPFDLESYASHVYESRTEKGKKSLVDKLHTLLKEIDIAPDKSDNPVSDFLDDRPKRTSEAKKTDASHLHATGIHSLLEKDWQGSDMLVWVQQVARIEPARGAREIRRKTRPDLIRELGSVVKNVTMKSFDSSIQEKDILNVGKECIHSADRVYRNIEQFGLAAVQIGWKEGVKEAMDFSGDLITMSESSEFAGGIRFASGLPSLLAWRLLILMGAKASSEESYELVDLLINNPIESEMRGRFTHRALWQRRNLFYSEEFLGYASFTVLYLTDLWDEQDYLKQYFESKELFHLHVAQFLMVVALTYAFHNEDPEFYPGYKLLPYTQVSRAMSLLGSRLASRQDFRKDLAKIIGFGDSETLERDWSRVATKANEAKLGGRYWDFGDTQFPSQLESVKREESL